MSIDAIIEKIKPFVEKSDFKRSVKFNCYDDGVILIKGNEISVNNEKADCIVNIEINDLMDLVMGDLDPTMAFIQGKIKVEGDMSIAMMLSEIIS